ncbi:MULTISPECIES: PACE efflux transporter [Corallincola]|nr:MULTISPECIES: PACE efflux transporter [Corallincola]TAA47325.1 PACE efflux transporter [Corallincola spongiicola]
MRARNDRIRHSIGYQLGSLGVLMPLISWLTGHPMLKLGVLALCFASLCACWNYLFSGWFDRVIYRRYGRTDKRFIERCLHACGIEMGILWLTTPLIAWWLKLSLLDALMMDIGLVVLYLVYTLAYNWLYDLLFPVHGHLAIPYEVK